MKTKFFFTLALFLVGGIKTMAQDLEALLDSQTEERTEYAAFTFKATRLLNGHSVERMQVGQLDFRIDHRFGSVKSGAYNFWGMDQTDAVHYTMDYGINDWFMVGIGRATIEKTLDGFAKFLLLRQSTGKVKMPVTVSLFLGTDYKGSYPSTRLDSIALNNLSYTSQLLIARKFNEELSVQIMPTFVHRNLVASPSDPNDYYAMGIGGRYKLSNRISVNAEYYHVLSKMSYENHNPLALGFDIETGGHVFQMFFTNAIWNTERGFITNTPGSWAKGDIHFGFKISRVFPLIPKKVSND